MDDIEEQENELLALESILDSDSFKVRGNNGFLKIQPQLCNSTLSVCVKLGDEYKKTNNRAEVNTSHVISYLPPITLSFTLPNNYPSTNAPEFTLSCKWLTRTQLETLCVKLDEIWDEQIGDVVLYNWVQFLENDSLQTLNIIDRLCIELESNTGNSVNDERVVHDIRNYSEVLPRLLMYNQSKINNKIRTSTFDCIICLDTRPGLQCIHLLECDHVFCKKCLSSYCHVNVSEGSVTALICPEPSCKTPLLPNQVKELVSSELYDRYEKLMLQTTLDTMTDVMYCPLTHCQSPVIVEPESTLAQCPSCSYAFCPYCRLSYHGVSPCKMVSGEIKKLCKEYKSGSPEKRKQMEKKYGRKALQKAIHDSENQKWLDSNAKSCPGCKASIEKSDGCNKMTCFKCRAYFCWLCMSNLCRIDPYKHYNKPGNSCYNRLFEGVNVNDFEEDDWFF